MWANIYNLLSIILNFWLSPHILQNNDHHLPSSHFVLERSQIFGQFRHSLRFPAHFGRYFQITWLMWGIKNNVSERNFRLTSRVSTIHSLKLDSNPQVRKKAVKMTKSPIFWMSQVNKLRSFWRFLPMASVNNGLVRRAKNFSAYTKLIF